MHALKIDYPETNNHIILNFMLHVMIGHKQTHNLQIKFDKQVKEEIM